MYENENINEQDKQYNESSICKKCKIARIDISESKHSILCSECREEQIRYPIPKIFIAIAIGLLVLVSISFFRFPKIFKAYKTYATAEQNVHDGNINDTLSSLEEVMKEYPRNVSMPVLATEISMENGRYDYAAHIIDTYLVYKKLDTSVYYKITNYTDRITAIYNTYDSYDKIISGLDENMDSNQVNEYMRNQLKLLLDSPHQDKALVNYYLSSFAINTTEEKEYIKQSIKEDHNLIQAHIKLANILCSENDFNSARKIYNEVLYKDKDCANAKSGLAVINMLEGNKKEAVRIAKEAYELDNNNYYVAETLIIALNEDGQTDEANKYMKEFVTAGNEFSNDIIAYMEGEITINDYYIRSKEENK